MHRREVAAFLNQKGGVGKTTSVVNIGAGLTILGKKVLIVDLDPQGHLTRFLGIDDSHINKTIYDVLRGEVTPQEAMIRKELGAKISIAGQDSRLTLTVIPANLEFAEAEAILSLAPEREYLLQKAMAKVGDDFDYILFDCPPSLGLVSTNALVAANKVFIPVQTEFLALESLHNLMRKIDSVSAELNTDLEIGGMLATRYDARKVLSRSVVQTLTEQYGAQLLENMIRENIVLAESPSYGKDIFSYRPRSHGAEDYLNLCLEIMGRVATMDSFLTVERGVITNRRSDATAAPSEGDHQTMPTHH